MQFHHVLAGESSSAFPWKPVLLCGAPLALCVAQVVSITLWHWMAKPNAVPEMRISMDSGQLRDTALAAVQNFELLCRESATKVRKEEGKRIAEQVPNTAMADHFAQQINESQLNIVDFAQTYSRAVSRLAQIEEQVARPALEQVATDSTRAAYVGAVLADTRQARLTPQTFDANRMSQSCDRLGLQSP